MDVAARRRRSRLAAPRVVPLPRRGRRPLRFPDTLSRLHAATKPQTLGLILILAGLALTLRTWAAVTTLVLLAATQFFTSPVSAHLVGRAAYRNRRVDPATPRGRRAVRRPRALGRGPSALTRTAAHTAYAPTGFDLKSA